MVFHPILHPLVYLLFLNHRRAGVAGQITGRLAQSLANAGDQPDQRPTENGPHTEGDRQAVDATHSTWDYENTAQILAEIAALTPSYAGVSHARLENGETFQWPVKDEMHPGTPILHAGQFARGKGKFSAIEHVPPAELPDDEYPMILSTGRVLYHWHGGQMSRRSKGLLEIYPQALIEINDANFEAEVDRLYQHLIIEDEIVRVFIQRKCCQDFAREGTVSSMIF